MLPFHEPDQLPVIGAEATQGGDRLLEAAAAGLRADLVGSYGVLKRLVFAPLLPYLGQEKSSCRAVQPSAPQHRRGQVRPPSPGNGVGLRDQVLRVNGTAAPEVGEELRSRGPVELFEFSDRDLVRHLSPAHSCGSACGKSGIAAP